MSGTSVPSFFLYIEYNYLQKVSDGNLIFFLMDDTHSLILEQSGPGFWKCIGFGFFANLAAHKVYQYHGRFLFLAFSTLRMAKLTSSTI
jgi:hypothetical protein